MQRPALRKVPRALPRPGFDVRLAEISSRHQYVAYDSELLPGLVSEVFDPEYLRAEGLLRATTSSLRGAVWVFDLGGNTFLLRHYRRGGAISRLVRDRYLWLSRVRTRPGREWCMLRDMREWGLPVPVPAAWRVVRCGSLFYRADLITVLIRGCETLHRLLLERDLPEEGWRCLGATLRRFHDCQVWHPDLTAGNILVDGEGCFHLVDFDRGRLRRGEGWKVANLHRLRRFLMKQRGFNPDLNYRDAHFHSLLDAYRNGS